MMTWCVAVAVAQAPASAQSDREPEDQEVHGQHHPATKGHDHTEEQLRREAMQDELRRRADPRLERPTGNVMVYVIGDMGADAAGALEEALVRELFRVEKIRPLAASVAQHAANHSPDCHVNGECMAVLARDLGANLVLTARVSHIDDTEVLQLRLIQIDRAEAIGSASTAIGPGETVESHLAATIAALLANAEPVPVHPLGLPVVNEEGGDWTVFDNPGPTIVGGILSTGTVALAIYASLKSSGERSGHGGGGDGDDDREAFETMRNVTWPIATFAVLATVAAAIVTDWSTDDLDSVPVGQLQIHDGGFALGMALRF